MKYIKTFENAPAINQIKSYILIKGIDPYDIEFFSILKVVKYYYDDRVDQAFIDCYKKFHIDKKKSRPIDTPMIKLRYSTIVKKFVSQSDDIKELEKLAKTILIATKYNL